MNGRIPGKPGKLNSFKGSTPFSLLNVLATPQTPLNTPLEPQRCNLEWAILNNQGAAGLYVKVFDTENAPILGSDVPVLVVYVPVKIPVPIYKCYFANGLWFAAATAAAQNGVTPPSANDCTIAGAFMIP